MTSLRQPRRLRSQRGVFGILYDNARDKAGDTAEENKYRFLNSERFSWTDAALSLGRSAEGAWIGAGSVPDSELPFLTFARVDTGELDEEHGSVAVTFMRVVRASGSYNLAPLGVCALSNTEIGSRSNAPARAP